MEKKLKKITWNKIVARILQYRVKWFYGKKFYPLLYKSGLNTLIYNNKAENKVNYFTAVPNRGAGIGHQMANWIAGYWFAKKFKLKFAHIPFSQDSWEIFLGFGDRESLVDDLVKTENYKLVKLPKFNEKNAKEVQIIEKIIQSYSEQNVVFVAEQDQFYKDQFGVIDEIKKKFHQSSERENDQLIYSEDTFNIAIHVRRGDIVIGQQNDNPNLIMRWLDNNYFENVLSAVIENIRTNKPIAIYLFSQGSLTDFSEFEKYKNIHFCLDMNAQDSFLHMVNADMLITSKSSFSYKPALLSKGIKICPSNFWHGYPASKDWILVDDEGQFDTTQLDIT
jgi:hypothetical protein